jgi:hypothetical protein
MAASETDFQREIVKDATANGYHCFKASNQYAVGVPDLYFRGLLGGIWIECKWLDAQASFRTRKICPTYKQHSFLEREINAGGCGSILIGYRQTGIDHNEHGAFIVDGDQEEFHVKRHWFTEDHPDHIRKERGRPWPVTRMQMRMRERVGFPRAGRLGTSE